MLNDSNPLTVIALHECSHAAIHHYFSHEISEVAVGEDDGHCRLAAQEVNALECIIGCCAGKAGFDKYYGWKSKEDQGWRESEDRKSAFSLALKVSAGDEQAADILVTWGERMADSLVSREWPKITKLAAVMIERQQLTGREVAQILK
jgi:hypothetical protein